LPHAYIKHRKANIKHFLPGGFVPSGEERQSRVKRFVSPVGRNMMIIVIAATAFMSRL
jgi:hypothetical protein